MRSKRVRAHETLKYLPYSFLDKFSLITENLQHCFQGGGLIYVSVSNIILGTQNPMSETKIFNSHFLMHDGSEVLENKVPRSRRPSSQWQHSTRPQVMGLLVMSSLINTSLHGSRLSLIIKTKVI